MLNYMKNIIEIIIYTLIIVIIILLILKKIYNYFFESNNKEKYSNQMSVTPKYIYNVNELWNPAGLGLWQIWNNPTRSTRNMSYDLRGDPLIIPYRYMLWNNSDFYY